MELPIVSVIIPVKERASELRRALKSVLSQTISNIEVLIIDDKSVNELSLVIKEFGDSRFKYILNNKDLSNANVCRNIGLDYASGRYVAMLDSDDEWLPNHLESKIKFLEENEADGVFGSYIIDDGKGKREVISRDLKPAEKMVNYLLSDGRAATPTQVYKTSCAKDVRWDETLLRHQDYDFSVRFSQKYRYMPCPEVTCIVHWDVGDERKEDLDSQIRFIQKFKTDISSFLYNRYHQKNYITIHNREDVEEKVKKYFKRESYRYIRNISFNDYYFIRNAGKKHDIFKYLSYRLQYYVNYFLNK